MSDSNTENTPTIDPNTDDLDQFSDLLFGNAKPAEVQETVEEPVEDQPIDDDPVAPEDSDEPEDETPDEPVEEHQDDKPRLKGKKKTFQDRIDELTRKAKDAERETETLRQELESLRVRKEPAQDSLPVNTGAPNPDAIDENGEPKYKLGEYDPQYLEDVLDYKLELREEQRREQARRNMQEAAQRELVANWEVKLERAVEEIPDLRERGERLEPVFAQVNPQFGEFLTVTLMSMDHGPEVLAYLSDNLDEAKRLVTSNDPVSAALKLGRLEAQFVKGQRKETRVSKAPEPPEVRARGTDGRFSIPADTDNLDDFEKLFFKK